MAALRVRNLNLLRRRALIAEAVVDVNGHAVLVLVSVLPCSRSTRPAPGPEPVARRARPCSGPGPRLTSAARRLPRCGFRSPPGRPRGRRGPGVEPSRRRRQTPAGYSAPRGWEPAARLAESPWGCPPTG